MLDASPGVNVHTRGGEPSLDAELRRFPRLFGGEQLRLNRLELLQEPCVLLAESRSVNFLHLHLCIEVRERTIELGALRPRGVTLILRHERRSR